MTATPMHHESGPQCYANALWALDAAARDEPDSLTHEHLLREAAVYAQLATAAAVVDSGLATGALTNGREWAAVTEEKA